MVAPEFFPTPEEQKITSEIFIAIRELALYGLSPAERALAALPYPEDDSRPEVYDRDHSATPIWQHAPHLAQAFELSLTEPVVCAFLPQAESEDPRLFEYPCCAIALTCDSVSPFGTLQYILYEGESLYTIEKGIEFTPLPTGAQPNPLIRLSGELTDIDRWRQELENETVKLEELRNLAELVTVLRDNIIGF